jgi:predicted nucleic acid-binding protein
MQPVVIDANVVLHSFLHGGRQSAKLDPLLEKSALVAPWLWRLEVANAVLVHMRRKLLTEAEAIRILRLIDEMPVEIVPEPDERTATNLLQIGKTYQLTAYDAVYLDLADRRGLPLFTLDQKLRDAAKRAGVPLLQE